ncbi:MAG: ABC transporter ATP-binding protein [Fimbriimonadaceae bacterium]
MIAVENLKVTFRIEGGEEINALRGINFSIEEGEFVTLIGTNGSGKSTVLNAIAGRTPISDGKILIDGQDVTHQPEFQRAKMIGRVFQNPAHGTCANLTVAENLRIAALRGSTKNLNVGLNATERERYRELLKGIGMGLDSRLSATAESLSGGQRQAVTLLMATIVKPRILLLDEHTAALDPRAAEQLLFMTDELIREHRLTALMVTHSMSQALSVGSRTIMLDNGRIEMDVSGREREQMKPEDLLDLFGELHRRDYLGG